MEEELGKLIFFLIELHVSGHFKELFFTVLSRVMGR